jgi:zinc transport system substrate-binding protein
MERRRAWSSKRRLVSAVGLGALLACGGDEPREQAAASEGGTPVVYTVNYPLQYFAQRITGDVVRVVFPAPADLDPAFWQPEAQVVAQYQAADLILLNGAGYAAWTSRVSLPAAKLVHTSGALEGAFLRVEGAVTHAHGPGGEHAHEGIAFTTWLDPTQAIQQAAAIRDAFAAAWPEHAATFDGGFAALEADLMALDEQFAAAVVLDPARPMLASHPVYQYLERRYGLNIESVQWEPTEHPSGGMWRDFRRLLSDHPANWMLWEAEPLAETAARLRELGVQPIVFDPCGNVPDNGDYLSVMQANAEHLARAYGRVGS